MRREALKTVARKAAVPLFLAALMAAGTITADAFTLISVGKPKVTTSPTSGLATAPFTTRGKFVLNGTCPVSAPVSLTFRFFWYKVISSKVPLWTKATTNCSGNTYDTGNSPALHPPSPLNYPGTFVVQVAVYLTSNGAPMGTTYTDTTLYGVIAPKPSPKATPRVSPSPSSSPSPAQCTAALPPGQPGGKDVEALLAVAGVGLLPIGGIAMLFSPGLWARRRDWAKLAAILGLTAVMLMSATACTPPNQLAGNSPESSPSQSVSPSPSPSPTPSC